MCCNNITSLGRREDPFDLKKEGVVTSKVLALHKLALAQSLLAVVASCKAPHRLILPPEQP